MNIQITRNMARPALLALAALTVMALAPAYAGQACDLIDGDVGVEDSGGSTTDPNNQTLACGIGNSNTGNSSSAVGLFNTVTADLSSAFGVSNTVSSNLSTAVGSNNTASGVFSTAVGSGNQAIGDFSNAFGSSSTATGQASIAIGTWYDANGNGLQDFDIDADNDGIFEASSELTRASGSNATAIGPGASAIGGHTTAVGPGASAIGGRSLSLGADSQAIANDSVALGSRSIADRANTVSVGAVGNERQITNVAAGTIGTDAVNVDQMTHGDAETLSSANAYTDNQIQQVVGFGSGVNDRLDAIDRRFGQVDARIDRNGAMSGALAGMATNSANLSGSNRMAVGVGSQGGRQAIAVGYQRALNTRASVSLGAAFSGSESTISGGAGFSW